MYIEAQFTNYYERELKDYKVVINGGYVTISEKVTKKIVFSRKADNTDWYDQRHVEIIHAIEHLQEAILATI